MRPGTRLRILRHLLGLTVKDFSEFLEISRKRFDNIETGVSKMNEEDFQQIAEKIPEAHLFVLLGNPMSKKALIKADSLLATIPDRVKFGLAPDNFEDSMLFDDF